MGELKFSLSGHLSSPTAWLLRLGGSVSTSFNGRTVDER